jgi:histone H3/H4
MWSPTLRRGEPSAGITRYRDLYVVGLSVVALSVVALSVVPPAVVGVKRSLHRDARDSGRLDRMLHPAFRSICEREAGLMMAMSVATFERLFREAGDLDVDKSDLKRYQEFARDKIADLLTIAQARAKADDRDVIESRDLPITKGLQESIHRFRRLDVGADVRPMLAEVAIRPQLDLAVAVDVDEMLPEVVGGLSVALAQTFRLIDPNVRNPATAQWERAFLIFDLLL